MLMLQARLIREGYISKDDFDHRWALAACCSSMIVSAWLSGPVRRHKPILVISDQVLWHGRRCVLHSTTLVQQHEAPWPGWHSCPHANAFLWAAAASLPLRGHCRCREAMTHTSHVV